MKAFLMHRDRDFDLERELPANEAALIQDLELETLLSTMAAGDRFMFEVARRALLLSLPDPEAIIYRQQVLADCLEQPTVVRELYALAGEALKAQKTVWWGLAQRLAAQDAGNLGSEDGAVHRLSQASARDGRRARASSSARRGSHGSSRCSARSSTRRTSSWSSAT